jgi:hypothetical protein
MTTLEQRIANLKLGWVWHYKAYTAVHNGFGFVIYYKAGQNWLAVLRPEIVKENQKCHSTTGNAITGFWLEYHGNNTERMFEVPVTPEFLTHVIEAANPEMLAL